MLSDLFICLISDKSLLSISSDYELTVGYHFFAKLLRSNEKCHEAMFGLARIHFIQGRYELAEKLIIKAYST
jgi:hypothetical protein